MTGAVLNGVAILLGAAMGMIRREALSPKGQQQLRMWLAAFALFIGITTVYEGVQNSFPNWLKALGIGLLALILGNVVGRFLGFQRGFERWLQRRMLDPTKDSEASATPGQASNVHLDFGQMLLWFVASPLMVIGIVQQGLAGDWRVLALKGLVDATAAYAWGVLSPLRLAGAAIGTTLLLAVGCALVRELNPWLTDKGVLSGVGVAAGLLIMNSSLVLLGGRRVALIDQAPALVVGPLLWYWWGPETG